MSKREGVAVGTLDKWKRKYGSQEVGLDGAEKRELQELRKKVAMYEQAMGELALEVHFLKKLKEYQQAQMRKKSSLNVISLSTLGLKGAVK